MSKILAPPIMKPLCTNNHPITKITFCRKCAKDFVDHSHNSMTRVFFCTAPGCMTAADLKDHSNHLGQKLPVVAAQFIEIYSCFIESVKLTNRMRFSHYILKKNAPKVLEFNQINEIMTTMIATNPPIYNSALRRNTLTQTPLAFNDLGSPQYRLWVVQSKFWQKNTNPSVVATIEEYVRSLFETNPGPNTGPDPQPDDFPIEIEPPFLDLKTQLERSKYRVAQLGREKLLTEFFLQVTACFSNEDIEKNIKECAKIQGELSGSLSFLLRLGKLKALELHDDCSKQMKIELSKIDPNLLEKPREKELFYYFSAIAEWQYVPQPEKNNQSVLFLDARNKKHYHLKNPQAFVNFLNKAIDINRNPIYLAARGLGYMTLKNYDRAAIEFEGAKKLSYSSDALDSNILLNAIRKNEQPNQSVFTQGLHNRKVEYIMSLCKVLEKKKRYRDLRRCYQELVDRQPRNLAFRVGFLRTLLKLKDTDSARHQLSQIKDLRQLPINEIEEFERRIELLRAYEQEKLGNYSDAEDKLEHAAKVGEPSASYWFNYAAFLFKNRNQRDNNEKALAAVNRALQIRTKDQYLELKYMLLFIMGNLEEAAKVQASLKNPIFDVMKEYVGENL